MDFPKAAVIGLIGDAGVVSHDYMLDGLGLPDRLRVQAEIESSRRAGATVLVRSAEPTLLRSVADEIWWFENGAVRLKGDPDEVLRAYQRETLKTLGAMPGIPCALRRGDGRARLTAIETLNAADQLVSAWQSGETARIRVRARFESPVDDPVIGIMIRTRIGIEVYGTNTELEKLKLGPCVAGDIRTVRFRISLRSLSAVLYNYSSVARPGRRLARLDGRCGRLLGYRLSLYRWRREPARSRHLLSRINVGAKPETVEKPFAPTGVTQVEQPFTLPRNECG